MKTNYRITNDGCTYFTHEVMGYDGNPVNRTKAEYPYSYDPFLVWVKDEFYIKNAGNAVYSDRLYQWDWDWYNQTRLVVWNNQSHHFYSGECSPSEIERFLRIYFRNSELELVKIAEGCNVSNGYPYWIFWYKDNK